MPRLFLWNETGNMIEHLLYLYLRTVLNKSWNELMAATHKPARMQAGRLLDILARNAETAFGKEHNFASIRSVEDFRERTPVREYQDFEPYIMRMCSGEENVLTAETPDIFCRTSGTTGTPKFIPVTPSYYEEFSKMQKMWQRKMVADHRRMLRGKLLSIASPEVGGHTKCGIPFGAMSGHSYKRQYPLAQKRYAVPYDVMCVDDFEAKYYLVLRLALEQNVTTIAAMNPSTILLLMKKLNLYTEELANDIAEGAINKRFATDKALREQLEEGLRPNTTRAKEIESLASSGEAIRGTDIWRELSLIVTWQGGSVGFYLKEFPKYFPGVPLRDMGLIATEGYYSIPLWPNTPKGLLAITGHFLEFFGVGSDGARDDIPLDCEALEKGKQYYIVATTSGGLYRYDIGDIIEVVDFYNKTPIIVFKQKGGNSASITGEKVTEAQVTEAMGAAADLLTATPEGFTLALKLNDPPSYALAVETSERDVRLLGELLARFENELRVRNIEYVEKRDSQRLGEPTLITLESGFFEKQRRNLVQQGAPDGQYKVPHLTSDTGFLEGAPIVAEITMPHEKAYEKGSS